jgi:hypothetical protein
MKIQTLFPFPEDGIERFSQLTEEQQRQAIEAVGIDTEAMMQITFDANPVLQRVIAALDDGTELHISADEMKLVAEWFKFCVACQTGLTQVFG